MVGKEKDNSKKGDSNLDLILRLKEKAEKNLRYYQNFYLLNKIPSKHEKNSSVDMGDSDDSSSTEAEKRITSDDLKDLRVQIQKEIKETKDEFKKSLSEFQKNFNDNLDELGELKTEIDKDSGEIKSEIRRIQLPVIETLGIFATLFTFISIEFQVFRMYRDPQAISGLTLVLLGSIAFLMSIFDYFIGYLENKKIGRYVIYGLCFVFIVLGIWLFSTASFETLDDYREEIKKEVKIELEQDFEKDMNAVVNDKLNNNEDMRSVQDDIKVLQEKEACMKYKRYWEYDKCFK